MSYLRFNSPYFYLYGSSDNYIFGSKEGIIDYGGTSNESIIEILLDIGKKEKKEILTHLGKRLAENLGIKLREKRLTTKQWLEEYYKKLEEVEKEVQGLGVKRTK